MEVMEIRNIGTYFPVDADGYLINPASPDKIAEPWRALVDDVVTAYRRHYPETLVAVFVRGSVAKGTAIEDVSDVDTFAYVDLPEERISADWMDAAEAELLRAHPFAQGIELSVDPVCRKDEDRIMLLQSACVYGTDISHGMPRLRPGRDLAAHSLKLARRFGWLRSKLDRIEHDEAELKRGCVWLGKTLLRSGFELTMERSKTYTRDLYPCYETFSRYYPEKEPEMREVLRLTLNPVADRALLERLMDGLGAWLEEEAARVYPQA